MTYELTTFPPKFRADGDVRGRGPLRTTPEAAIGDILRDRRSCSLTGGYSDQVPTVVLTSSGRYDGTWTYGVGAELDDQGLLTLTHDADWPDEDRLLKVVGEQIADGKGDRRPKLKRDDWKGWLATRNGLFRVFVAWPDDENLLPNVDVRHVCDINR
jgi:hypothetical protein